MKPDGIAPRARELAPDQSFAHDGDGRSFATVARIEPTPREKPGAQGVVEDVPQFGPAAGAEPQIYLPHPQSTFGSMGISVRTRLPAASIAAETRTIALALEPRAIASDVTTLRDALDENPGQPRFYAQLLLVFAGVATFLACLGLYGLRTFAVTSRRQELGIRAALGATPQSLISLVVCSYSPTPLVSQSRREKSGAF